MIKDTGHDPGAGRKCQECTTEANQTAGRHTEL